MLRGRVGCLRQFFHTDGRTDRKGHIAKVIDAFLNFAKAPKNCRIWDLCPFKLGKNGLKFEKGLFQCELFPIFSPTPSSNKIRTQFIEL